MKRFWTATMGAPIWSYGGLPPGLALASRHQELLDWVAGPVRKVAGKIAAEVRAKSASSRTRESGPTGPEGGVRKALTFPEAPA
jgi:hypothetical protein